MDGEWGQLDKNLIPEYSAWKKKPDKSSRGALLRKLQPSIDRGISAHVGKSTSPVLRSSARRLALGALDTYDPQRARLSTHVINHMKGLRRIARQQQQVLKMPERVALDRNFLFKAETELTDTLGREPTITELADHTRLSERRIRKVQSFANPVYEGSLLAMTNGEGGGGFEPQVEQESMDTISRAVYEDLDPTNQNIMAWTLGLNGRQYSNQQIASKLGLTPGAVSQRKQVIQSRLDEVQELGLF